MPSRRKKSSRFLVILLSFAAISLLSFFSFNKNQQVNEIATDEYVSFIKNQSEEFDKSRPQAIFLNNVIESPEEYEMTDVLGDSTSTEDVTKTIEVDLSEQKLYMKENNEVIGTFLVSTGRWFPTPTGEWEIWSKYRYKRMKGGSKEEGTFYDLPNVPYTMFYNQGFGIHGAYWHNNFGQPMSHGCVNMRPEEAGIIFGWAQVGTKVIVRS